jgi:NADPH:quinone reductase-like Zn-dependent oxidoreductase
MKPQPTNTPETREPTKNHQILLSSRPRGEPSQDNFQLAESEIPKPGPGQMLLGTIYLSLDPYMQGRMNAGPSYAPPLEMGGQSVCEVVESNLPNYHPGDIVLAATGWQEFSLSNGEETQKIDRSLRPISYALGVLGMPGFTAYAGLLNIGRPQSGKTIVVAAASGAVGSVVGQIAKIKGCRHCRKRTEVPLRYGRARIRHVPRSSAAQVGRKSQSGLSGRARGRHTNGVSERKKRLRKRGRLAMQKPLFSIERPTAACRFGLWNWR